MDDDLHHRITELVEEEHRLERGHSGRESPPTSAPGSTRWASSSTGRGTSCAAARPARRAGQDPDAEQERPAPAWSRGTSR